MNLQEPLTEADFHRLIREAWDAGRTIVPIIGAGASADSGFPALASVVRYVAKLACYLKHQYFLPIKTPDIPFHTKASEFSQEINQYVSVFGWPDRFQLHADLRRRLQHQWPKTSGTEEWGDENQRDSRGRMDFALCLILDELAGKINPGGASALNNFLKNIKESNNNPKLIFPVDKTNSFLYQVVGDWKPLLRHASCHQPELVDALFSSLAKNRKPGTTHILLAHLTQLLRIRTLFTFNFDPFIESSLAKENIGHRVYAMEHGMELPSRHHIDDTVAVIKMHGSTHNILVDERVDYRVSERYREQFRDLVGRSPVFLVMGCSGNDRRLVDLIGDVMRDKRLTQPQTIWVHHKQGDKGPEALRGQIRRFGTFDLGQALQRLFESLTDRLPTSTAPYVAHINRPVIAEPVIPEKESKPHYLVHTRAVTKFEPVSGRNGSVPTTSRAFMHALAELPLGYTRISVDLEEHHSLEQIVAEVIDQVRRGDSSIPSFVTPGGIAQASTNEDQQEHKKRIKQYAKRAAERVALALRRSRYVLSISGIDAFPFRATTHHGLTCPPKQDEPNRAIERLNMLFDFLVHLAAELNKDGEWSLGDSVLVLHYETPYARHGSNQEEIKAADEVLKTITQRLAEIHAPPEKNEKYPAKIDGDLVDASDNSSKNSTQGDGLVSENWLYLPPEFEALQHDKAISRERNVQLPKKIKFHWQIATAMIVFHRRTRTRTGLLQLIKELFRGEIGEEMVKNLQDSTSLPGWMCWTEEGGLWCDRPARDWIYDLNTKWTATDKLTEANSRHLALAQSLQATVTHDRIARNYYLNQFLPSRDPFLFLEYVYHRVSTLRYLRQIQCLLACPNIDEILRKADQSVTGNTDVSLFSELAGYAAIEHQANTGEHQANPGLDSGLAGTQTEWVKLFSCLSVTLTSENFNERLQNIVKSLRELRVRCFRGLHQTWARSESYLRRVLPPGQMIEWCNNLLEYQLNVESVSPQPERIPRSKGPRDSLTIEFTDDEELNALFSDPNSRSTIDEESIRKLVQSDCDENMGIHREKKGLVELIRNTLFRAMYAHASYKEIISDSRLCGEDQFALIASAASTASADVHWQLNLKVATLWDQQSSGGFCAENYLEVKQSIQDALGRASEKEAFSEARLRLFYLQAEISIAEFAHKISRERGGRKTEIDWTLETR